MSGVGSRHPGYDSDTRSTPFGELWTSISHRRVVAVDAAMGATVSVQCLTMTSTSENQQVQDITGSVIFSSNTVKQSSRMQ